MQDFISEDIPWLAEDRRYQDGIELGAILMVCKLNPSSIIKAKIRWGNEDQLRIAAPRLGYKFECVSREEDWAHVKLTAA